MFLFKLLNEINKNIQGRKWQKRRRILTPGFHFNVLHKYAETFLETANKMVDDLRMGNEPKIKNLEQWISQHFLAIICGKCCYVIFITSF